jgi:hypothetical protein
MRIADLPFPDTQAAVAAVDVAMAYCSPALLNHSIRSWLWARGFADLEKRRSFDDELLFVSALLHDLGLTEGFEHHALPFEVAGGHVGWVLTAGAGWGVTRRGRVAQVIERHMWTSVDPEIDVEGYLLETATGFDISGSRSDALPGPFVREVMERYPRLDLNQEFGRRMSVQATRVPRSAAERLVRGGLVDRLDRNPLNLQPPASRPVRE